jgi:hypothetical protein
VPAGAPTTEQPPQAFAALQRFLRERFEQNGPLFVITVLLLLDLLLYQGCLLPLREARLRSEAKANLHTLQLAVERFAVDTEGNYPQSTALLLQKGYLVGLPTNPFSGRPMEEYRLGEIPPPGDFVYAPVRDEFGSINRYYIVMGREAALRLSEELQSGDRAQP